MKLAHRNLATEAEYLDRERQSIAKHEYVNGEIVAMAGATMRHNLITTNVIGALRNLLAGRPCLVLGSDQRVNVQATRMYTYPDVSVLCGKPAPHPQDSSTLLNPQLIVEVLSDSTEAYDRGAKFAHYQTVDSLAEYMLVSQGQPRVEHYRRMDSGQWLLTVTQERGAITLPALGVDLSLDEVYLNIELLPPAESS